MTAHNSSRLLSGAAEVIPLEEFDRKLDLGRPLRVKLGLDPTAPAVTLGWAVVLRKLRHFQEAGHTAVLIVGDFTARVGDPSGKSETRPRLSKEVVQGHAAPASTTRCRCTPATAPRARSTCSARFA